MKKVSKDIINKDEQICIVDNKTGEVWTSNATSALHDFETISKSNKDFSLFFPADNTMNIR